MTKKDYCLIANVISDQQVDCDIERDLLRNLVIDLSEWLKADNPSFDEEVFKEACGWPINILVKPL